MLRRFNMDKMHQVSTPMIDRSLDIKKDLFRLKDEYEEVLGLEVLYLSAIGALLYLAQSTRPDITFSVNLLARVSSVPTQCYWNGVKNIFQNLKGTIDLGLFFSYEESKTVDGIATPEDHGTDCIGDGTTATAAKHQTMCW